jgi:lipoprotein-anchoring transpeptidase ErfK/SrfK
VSGLKTVTISALTRRRAMAGGTAALIVAPFVIRPGFAQSPAVNIGVIQPLSGANAQFGINCRNGIEFVADAINAAGGIKALGGAKINLIVSDATSDPTKASTAAQRLITQNQVPGAYQRHIVDYHRKEAPGTVVIDTDARYLITSCPGTKRFAMASPSAKKRWLFQACPRLAA